MSVESRRGAGPDALVAQALADQAEALRLDAATPLRLDLQAGAYLVRRGHVDLYCADVAGAEPVGVRRFLTRCGAGTLLPGCAGGGGPALLAVGGADCEALVLSEDRLAGLPRGQQAQLIESWVLALSIPVFGAIPAWPGTVGEAGEEHELAVGSRLHAARGLLWATPLRGRLRNAGAPAIDGGALPLADGLCVEAVGEARVRLLSTTELSARGWALAGLRCFHQALPGALRRLLDQQEEAARQRLQGRDAAGRRSLARALGLLAGTLDPRLARAEPGLPEDALADAFAQAAAALGTAAPAPAGKAGLAELARAAGIGTRDVLLREGWWRYDSGPLIASRQQDGTAVALLPDGRGGYRLAAPGAAPRRVDGALAASLSGKAVQLYGPLPAQLRGIGELARFALSGGLRDLGTLWLAGLFGGALAALLPLATGYVFQWIIPHAESQQLPAVVLGLALAACGAAAFELSRAVALLRLEGRMEAVLQPALMQRLLALPARFFRGFGVGDLSDRLLGVQRIRQLLAGSAAGSLLSGLFSLVSFVVILYYSLRLALLAALLGGFAMLVTALLAWAQLRQERLASELRGREQGLVVQLVQGIAKVRVGAAEPRLFAVWAELFGRHKARAFQGLRYANARALFYAVYPLLTSLVLFAAMARLPRAPAPGGLGLGGFLAVYAAFGQLLAALTATAGSLTAALGALPQFERMRPLVEAAPEARAGRSDPGALSGEIEVCGLGFRYVANGPAVLDGVSLRVTPGQFVAIVGASGSGKSTLLRLLLGFETPDSGDILYQGRSIATLDPVALRRRMGVVLQHGRIVSGSIFDNITGGLPYTHDEAWAAARMAGLEADIKAMPMGMHTQVIEGVSTFSGGQYQRLMIARALIGKPQVLMFDEATSALDNATQALVTASLERLHVTRVVIAHRLSTVRGADCIHVLDGGRLVQSGSYDSLMAADGPFRALARRQLA
jgi:NHLM bacteriocin system ABC transporter ATP-binding protein